MLPNIMGNENNSITLAGLPLVRFLIILQREFLVLRN